MIIAHVVAPAPFGGLERVVRALVLGHAQRGHSMHLLNIFEEGERVVPIDIGDEPSATTHIVRVPRRKYWHERRSVRALCRQLGVDVIHTHGYRPDVIDSSVARGIAATSVTTVHGFIGGSTKTRLFERLQVRAFRRMDAVVAVSHVQMDFLRGRGVPSKRLHHVPNAWFGVVNPPLPRALARAELGIPSDATCIGWAGRLSREKGPDVLLDALSRLTPPRPLTVILGSGSQQAALTAQIDQLKLENVRLAGSVPDAGRLYAAFDAFVLSSRTEGTPITLFEAIDANVPVIATTVGGVPDVVTPTEAELVSPEDPDALAAAIRRVLSDTPAARARSASARQRVAERFQPGPWLDAYEKIYRDSGRR